MPIRRKTRLWAITALILAAISALPATSASSDQKCTGCHSGDEPASGYILSMPRLSLSCPAVVAPDSAAAVTMRVFHPGRYILESPHATLNLTGDDGAAIPANASAAPRPLPVEGGIATAAWTFKAGRPGGKIDVLARLDFTARFPHSSGPQTDRGRFALTGHAEISVQPVELLVTEGELLLAGDGRLDCSFEIVSVLEARNITVVASGDLGTVIEVSPATIGAMHPGQRQTIGIELKDPSVWVRNGRLDVFWEDANGTRNATFVMLRVQAREGPPAQAGLGAPRLIGRATGILLLGLLAASAALGFKKGGGRRRVRVHCAVSWFMTGLALYHGLLLALGPYSKIMWSGYLVLGYATAAVMGASGLNGALQRPLGRRLGRARWLWIHRVLIMAAVIMVLVHAIALGTDIAVLREPFGGRLPAP